MEVAKTENLVDYAMPCMKAEKALKEVHDAALLKNYEEAIRKSTEVIVEARILQHSLKIMQERGM